MNARVESLLIVLALSLVGLAMGTATAAVLLGTTGYQKARKGSVGLARAGAKDEVCAARRLCFAQPSETRARPVGVDAALRTTDQPVNDSPRTAQGDRYAGGPPNGSGWEQTHEIDRKVLLAAAFEEVAKTIVETAPEHAPQAWRGLLPEASAQARAFADSLAAGLRQLAAEVHAEVHAEAEQAKKVLVSSGKVPK